MSVPRKYRSRRSRGQPRSRTISMKHITRESLRVGAAMYPPVEGEERPATREDCLAAGVNAERPCPWVACKHHLYLDINPNTGTIKLNFPDLEPWELKHTCALDVAELGGITLDEIGLVTNLTRERIRQIEVRGLLAMREESIKNGVRAEDATFAHAEGFQHPDAESSSSTRRKESADRARAAYVERQRAAAAEKKR